MLLQVYAEYFKIKYKSALCSKATLITVVFGVFSIVLPFIVAYKSKGLWLKREVFYEQPDVKFKGEYLFIATTNDINVPIICTTFPAYSQVIKAYDYCSTIKVREINHNFDNKIDETTINLRVLLPKYTKITSLVFIIPIDYQLHDFCPLQMQSAIIYQHYLPFSVSELSVFGDLEIIQSQALNCYRRYKHNFYNYSIVANQNDSRNYNYYNIINEYTKRNLTTRLTNVYTNAIMANTDYFITNLVIKYPEHKLYYKPGFWQIIKYAWIQYYAVYIIFAWIFHKIKHYIFTNRLVLFYKYNPIKNNIN